METLSISNLFGDVSALEEATGLDAITINGITLAVLIILCLGDVLICCCGTLMCCCMCCRRSARTSSYQLSPVERNTTHLPRMSRLSRISTTGEVEMEWVQKSSQGSETLSPIIEKNIYHNQEDIIIDPRASSISGYVPMGSVNYPRDNNNYDDIMNVNPNFGKNMPHLYPDKDVYDDITNVRNPESPIGYENVLSVRMDHYNEKLI